MNFSEIMILSVGLAMDAFAVAVASGFVIKHPKLTDALKIGVFFGVFQAMMPILGWLGGYQVSTWIEQVDHWVAFALLFFIGAKMIGDGMRCKEEAEVSNPLVLGTLVFLSLATSVDALAAGISLAFLKHEILFPALMIGLVTFFLSFLGVGIGNRFGYFLKNKVKVFGGLVLILLGIKILVEHLSH